MYATLDGIPARRSRRQVALAALGIAIALALPASAQAASFKITPHIANHTPTVNKKWPLRLTVMSGTKKLSGSVRYQFLFSGTVVSRQPGHKFTRGVYTDTMIFPPNSLGQQLTLRILVTVPHYGTEHVDWKIATKR